MQLETSFGRWLSARRKGHDLTQQALAEQIGCSPDMIHKIEAGTARPSRQLADLLLDALEVPAEQRAPLIQLARPPISKRDTAAFAEAAPTSTSTIQSATPNNLPHPPTRFIGRGDELEKLSAL